MCFIPVNSIALGKHVLSLSHNNHVKAKQGRIYSLKIANVKSAADDFLIHTVSNWLY